MTPKIPINVDEVEIRIREVKDKPGKPIVIVFEDCRLLSDIRCMDKDTDKCDRCGTRFKCLSGLNLEINFLKELRCEASDNFDVTLNEMVEAFLRAKKPPVDK